MELTFNLSPESITCLTNRIKREVEQPGLAPVGLTKEDTAAVAKVIMDERGDSLARQVADNFSVSDIADHVNLDDIASNISVREVAERVNIDASDIADNIDLRELAQHLDLDTDEIAEKAVESIDYSDLAREVADQVDYDTLAEAMNTKALAREIVGQFINNEEFRKSFMDTLLSTMKNAISQ